MKSTLLACTLALGAAWTAAAQTQIDLRTQGRNIDFSGAGSTKPFRMGTLLPGSCSVGEVFFKTDAAAGANLYACTAAGVWTLQSGGSPTFGGDISGTPGAAVVGGLQGRAISPAAPADGEVLRWSGAASQWQPFPSVLSGGSNYSQAFSGATSVTIAGTAHGLGTANVIVDCYDAATPAARLEPASVTVHPATFDVTVTFSSARSGRCVVNGSGASGGVQATASNTFAAGTAQTFQGALVATSAERTAPVKAGMALPAACAAGDQFFKTDAAPGQNLYFCTAANTWTQMAGAVSGTIGNSQLAAGIDAVKIGAGTVNNTVFGYLANVTGDVQAQLLEKAAASHTHTATGDASGDLGSLRVTAIQGRAVSPAAPAGGQALVWNAGGNTWEPATVAGGGGAGMAAQLNDFAVARTSGTVLTIGANCSDATPCNVRFGNSVYSVTQSCTATLGASTAMAYVYVAADGILTVGHDSTVAAAGGCVAQAGVTNFPADSIPLYGWTATGGAWDVAGGRDYRAMLSAKGVSAGAGIATVESGGRTTVSVDTAMVPTYLAGSATIDFPSIAHGACSADQTVPVYGATAGDAVAPGWPGTLAAGLVGMMRVSAADTVAVRLCNLSGAAADPASATFRAVVVRSF
ncbi:MAG: hypothetical protein ACM336_17765 [Acidobacteriota bacterium]